MRALFVKFFDMLKDKNSGKIGAGIAFVFALFLVIFGFLKTLFIIILTVIGYVVGALLFSDKDKVKDWMDKNPKEVQDLAGGSSYSRYNRDDAGVPGTTRESWDVFGVTADQSPQMYKSSFKVPLKNESETIEGLAKDEIERRMQRGDKLSKDYATRRQIHDKGTGSSNVDWKAKVWAPDVKSFIKDKQSLNPGSAGLRRFGLWGTREVGVGDPQEGLPNWLIGERDPIYEQVRTRGVPTKNKEKK